MDLIKSCIGVHKLLSNMWTNPLFVGSQIRMLDRKLRFGPVNPGDPGPPKSYWRRVIYPEDGKYTTKPLRIRKLGGRDPETGRKVVSGVGGGQKQLYRWVLYDRYNKEDKPTVERVFKVRQDPLRSAKIALVCREDKARWIIASENMEIGQLITTYTDEIPRIPVKPKEGDTHPVGALPIGTSVHCLEVYPRRFAAMCRAAGTQAVILRKVDDRVILQVPSKREISIDQKCMAVVGRVSNIDHGDIPIGSVNKMRWMGIRQRSGKWHRKDGYCGRKVKPPKPVKVYTIPAPLLAPLYKLTF